jgi:hypothetical protein
MALTLGVQAEQNAGMRSAGFPAGRYAGFQPA